MGYNASSGRMSAKDGKDAETVFAYIVTEVNRGAECEKLERTGAE